MAKIKTSTLPMKRSPDEEDLEMSPPEKKSKADLRRQSLAKAKEWAADRKRKKDGDVDDDDDIKKSKKPIDEEVVVESRDVEEEEEERDDVVDKLPLIPTRRSTRARRGTSKMVAAALAADHHDEDASEVTVPAMDDESVGTVTRRSSRRRTMNAATTAPTATKKVTKAPTRRSRRKTVAPVSVPEEAPEITVEAIEIKVEAPEITVEAVKIKVEAPEITVEAVKIKVEAPEITVEAPEMKTEAPEITVEAPEMKTEEPELKTEEVISHVEVKEEQEVIQEEMIAVKEEVIMEEMIAVKEEVIMEEMIAVKEEVIMKETVVEPEKKVESVVEVEIAVKEEKEVLETESTQNEDINEVEKEVETKKEETVSAERKTSMIGSLLQHTPEFFQAVLIQWTLVFATLMTLCFDWWTLENGPDNEQDIMASQREPCVILGLWLVTIVGFFIALGAQSRAGWILTCSALSMTSFSTKLMLGSETSVPALPIYSYSGYNVNVPDMLVVLSLVGCAAILMQPKSPVPKQLQVAITETEEEDAPQVEPADTIEKESVTPAESSGPRSFIGQRVAVEKGGIDTFFGTVKNFDTETREWTVRYDDEFQEEEELNRVQLGSAFKLHSKNLSDNLKAMWRAGEL